MTSLESLNDNENENNIHEENSISNENNDDTESVSSYSENSQHSIDINSNYEVDDNEDNNINSVNINESNKRGKKRKHRHKHHHKHHHKHDNIENNESHNNNKKRKTNIKIINNTSDSSDEEQLRNINWKTSNKNIHNENNINNNNINNIDDEINMITNDSQNNKDDKENSDDEENTNELINNYRLFTVEKTHPYYKIIYNHNKKFIQFYPKINHIIKPFYPKNDNEEEDDDQNLIDLLCCLEKLWMCDDPSNINEINIMGRVNLQLHPTTMLHPSQIYSIINNNVQYSICMLEYKFRKSKIITENPGDKESVAFINRFERLYELVYSTCHTIYHISRIQNRLNNGKSINNGNSLFQWQPFTQELIKKPIQRFIIFLLRKLMYGNYRRCKNDVYEAIFTSKGHFTNAWKKYMSIDDFIHSSVNINTDFTMFLDITSNLHCVKLVSNFLKSWKLPMFPDLKKNRYLLAFENGIYYVNKDIFKPYDDDTLMFSNYEIYRGENFIKMSKNRMKKNQLSSSTIRFDDLENQYVCANYIEVNFTNYSHIEHALEIPTENFDKIFDRQLLNIYPRNYPEDCNTDEERKEIRYDYIQNIKGVIYALLGRTLFEGGYKDDWQIALFLLGRAGTGKSTLFGLIRDIYPIENIGVMSNNVETQWALSSVCGEEKFNIWITEIGRNFKWSQTEFQSCIAMEPVSIAKKNTTAFIEEWSSHVSMSGNVFPHSWQDQGENLKRRLAIFPMNEKIPKVDSDPMLSKKLYEELPSIIQKIVRCYLFLTTTHGKEDFWKICPDYFTDTSNDCLRTNHPLISFIEDYGQINMKPESHIFKEEITTENGEKKTVTVTKLVKPYCKKIDFISAFRKYTSAISIHEKIAFNREYYNNIFEDYGFKVIRNPNEWYEVKYPETLIPKDKYEYIYGCNLVDHQVEEFS